MKTAISFSKSIKFASTALIAALTLASCVKNESLDISEGRAIAFKNAIASRAATAVDTGTFNIMAYKAADAAGAHDDEATINDTYNLATNKYGFQDMYYYDGVNAYWFYGWAKGNSDSTYNSNTSFTAADSGATFSCTSGGVATLSFTSNAAGDVDLVAMATSKIAAASQMASQPIVFKHALSRVRFTAKTTTYDPTGAPIAITNLTFKTANNACTVGFSGKTEEGNTTDIAVTATGGTAITYALSGAYQTNLTVNYADVTTDSRVFYVVPQALGADALVVNYTVAGQAQEKTFNLSTYTLLPGKSYNFALTIDLKTITFTAKLENWDPVTATEI